MKTPSKKNIKLAFKIDIDTYEGISLGLPVLRKFFKEENIKASFFITFGPDFSGRAIFRIFKKKGFLEKMFRTGAVQMYGWRTILSGLLLPPKLIGLSFGKELRHLAQDGHEVGIHSWDHTKWHDYLPQMSLQKVETELAKGWEAFYSIFGFAPQSTAAAGWMTTHKSLYVQDQMDLLYSSDSRGTEPFFPVMEGIRFHTLQIPSTLPTFDEAVGRDGCTVENFHTLLAGQLKEGLNVHTIHTETEGMSGFPEFKKLVETLKERGVSFLRLIDEAKELLQDPGSIPESTVTLREIPGRSGAVACQG